jgi:hypothetical protein
MMRRTALGVAAVIAMAIAGSLVACDSPNRPSENRPPPPPAAPVLTSLAIEGPSTVAPSETAQFTATAHYSDGSNRNVTSEPGTVWRTSFTRVLTISATGLATGGDRGEASVTANFTGRTAVKSGVIVVPPGTYRLAGTITDTGIPLVGARVEVTHGPATGMVTSASPTYRLYGVSGDTEIRVTKDGYQDGRKRIQVTSHETADFELIPSRPRENVEGAYTLTITASDGCSQLPPEAMVRRFSASLTQQGPRITATLGNATFLTLGTRTYNRFFGTFDGDRLIFTLFEPYYYYYYGWPDVIEQLNPSTYLRIGGVVSGTFPPSGGSGSLSGTIGTMGGAPRYEFMATCQSAQHRFTLAR